MKKFIVLATVLLFAVSFSANAQNTYKGNVSKRTIPHAMGEPTIVQAANTTNIVTEGRGDLNGYVSLQKIGAATTTINVISGGSIGDIITLQTYRASEDVVINEGSTLILGASTRTLSDPADKIMLIKRTATIWDEVGFADNN